MGGWVVGGQTDGWNKIDQNRAGGWNIKPGKIRGSPIMKALNASFRSLGLLGVMPPWREA